ncbi:MAG: hypothetical protein AAF401_01150 [Pseudomonadota bacterium]
MKRILIGAALAAFAAPAAACISIGPKAEFCGQEQWRFEQYVDEGVLHLITGDDAALGFYHLHKLRPVPTEEDGELDVFEKFRASFKTEYGQPQFANVLSSEGERNGLPSLEYEFSVKDWEEGNRTRLTFFISGGSGYSFVTSGQPPVDAERLNDLHEGALAAFKLKIEAAE